MRIGIDLGGTTIIACLVDENNNIVKKMKVETLAFQSSKKVIERICNLISTLIEECGISNIQHIGIGCPGILDRKNGTVLFSNNFGWENVVFTPVIRKKFNVPVYMENDANCAAIGEYTAGAGKNYKSMVMVTLGTGIGGAIILNDKLYNGFNNNASILGHMLMVQNGEMCNCGRKGCWEVYGSVTALIKMANEAADKNPMSLFAKTRKEDGMLDGKNIFKAIKIGDETSQKIYDEYIVYLAEGITNIVNVLDPEAVVIGGGISKQGELIWKPVGKLVNDLIYYRGKGSTVITTSLLGNDAGIIGAACLDKF